MRMHLPSEVPFYHLGRLEHLGEAPLYVLNAEAIAEGRWLSYRCWGDLNAWHLMRVPAHAQDDATRSQFAEAGNLIASRWVTDASSHFGFDLHLSPPEDISSDAVARMLNGSRDGEFHQYVHRHTGGAVPFEWVILFAPHPQETRHV